MIEKILERKGAAIILIALTEGNKKMTELQSLMSNYNTIKNTVGDLEKMRLVKIKERFENRRIIYVSLTDVGRRYAEKFRMICDDGVLPEHVLNDIDKILKSTKKWNSSTEFVREAILEKIERTTNNDGS